MSLKSDKVMAALQDLQRLVQSRVTQHPEFSRLLNSLEQSAIALKEGKLALSILSPDQESTELFHGWMAQHSMRLEPYHMRVELLPDDLPHPMIQSTTTITLLLPPGSPRSYELTGTQPMRIGRHPNCSIVIPDTYGLVSGHHATLHPTPQKIGWEIRDTSRNGTYVNGEPAQPGKSLEEGNSITLGLPYPTASSPELRVNYAAPCPGLEQPPWLDCDIVCHLVQAGHPLSPVQQRWISHICQSAIERHWIAVLLPTSLPSDDPSIQSTLDELQSMFQPQGMNSPLEIFPLHLPSEEKSQQRGEGLVKRLETLVKRRPEDIVAKRLTLKIMAQMDWVSDCLTLQEKILAKPSQGHRSPLQPTLRSTSTPQLAKILKEIHEEKGTLFKQARDILKQQKSTLLDDYLEQSILNRIRYFAAHLKPYVYKRQGRTYIQLKLPRISLADPPTIQRKRRKKKSRRFRRRLNLPALHSVVSLVEETQLQDANAALLNFCQTELSTWAAKEWDDLIYDESKGIICWLQLIHDRLGSSASSMLAPCEESLQTLEQPPDLADIFNESFAKPSYESQYQEPLPVFYILKKVRSQWMQVIFLFSFFSILGIAGRRQIMQYLTQPIIAAFQYSPWIATIASLAMLYLVGKGLVQIYRADREDEREKEAKKLRDGLCSYYQSLVKNRLVDKVIQRLLANLDQSEHSIDRLLHQHKQFLEQGVVSSQGDLLHHASEAAQIQIPKGIDNYRTFQKEICQDKANLQKLKRSLDRKGSITEL